MFDIFYSVLYFLWTYIYLNISIRAIQGRPIRYIFRAKYIQNLALNNDNLFFCRQIRGR